MGSGNFFSVCTEGDHQNRCLLIDFADLLPHPLDLRFRGAHDFDHDRVLALTAVIAGRWLQRKVLELF